MKDQSSQWASAKTVLTDDGPVAIDVPRDRDGTFDPVLVPKHARRLPGFDDKVLALYARGLPTREIQHYLQEIYAIEVSPDLISAVTDAVVAEVTAWQTRPLEPMYPVVFFDALRVRIRDEGVVRSKAEMHDAGLQRRLRVDRLTAWSHVIPFFAFPPDVRRVIYTTNALESVNAGIRKVIKTRGHFPSDDAAMKLIWLALRNIRVGWAFPAARWKPALHAFAVAFGDRFLRPEA